MAWLQLHLSANDTDVESLQSLLEDLGAVAVTITDAADQPLFEPPPGETPLWKENIVSALFEQHTDAQLLKVALQQALGEPLPTHRFEILEDQPWERAWMDDFKPMRFGQRLWIVPSWSDAPDAEAVNLRLDPGLAFGTGTHETTALCLEWLDGADLRDEALEYLDDAVGAAVATYCVSDIAEEWDLEALLTEAKTLWPSQIELAAFEAASSTQELHDMLYDEALALYETRERELGEPVLRQVERQVMLRIIDQRWRQHLREMDLLREGIHLRAMGQKDPATEWQREGFEMFGMMMTGIANDFVKYVMHVQVSGEVATQPGEPAIADMTETKREASAGTSAAQIADANAPKVVEANQQRSKTPIVKTELEKVGRNDPCPCGSGKKYKNCWGKPGCSADI